MLMNYITLVLEYLQLITVNNEIAKHYLTACFIVLINIYLSILNLFYLRSRKIFTINILVLIYLSIEAPYYYLITVYLLNSVVLSWHGTFHWNIALA